MGGGITHLTVEDVPAELNPWASNSRPRLPADKIVNGEKVPRTAIDAAVIATQCTEIPSVLGETPIPTVKPPESCQSAAPMTTVNSKRLAQAAGKEPPQRDFDKISKKSSLPEVNGKKSPATYEKPRAQSTKRSVRSTKQSRPSLGCVRDLAIKAPESMAVKVTELDEHSRLLAPTIASEAHYTDLPLERMKLGAGAIPFRSSRRGLSIDTGGKSPASMSSGGGTRRSTLSTDFALGSKLEPVDGRARNIGAGEGETELPTVPGQLDPNSHLLTTTIAFEAHYTDLPLEKLNAGTGATHFRGSKRGFSIDAGGKSPASTSTTSGRRGNALSTRLESFRASRAKSPLDAEVESDSEDELVVPGRLDPHSHLLAPTVASEAQFLPLRRASGNTKVLDHRHRHSLHARPDQLLPPITHKASTDSCEKLGDLRRLSIEILSAAGGGGGGGGVGSGGDGGDEGFDVLSASASASFSSTGFHTDQSWHSDCTFTTTDTSSALDSLANYGLSEDTEKTGSEEVLEESTLRPYSVNSSSANSSGDSQSRTTSSSSSGDCWESAAVQPFCALCNKVLDTEAALEKHVKFSAVHAANLKKQLIERGEYVPDDEEQQNHRLLYSGSKFFCEIKWTIELSVFEHFDVRCIEVVPYDPLTFKELDRVYLSLDVILGKIGPEIERVTEEERAKHFKTNKYLKDEDVDVAAIRSAEWRKAFATYVLRGLTIIKREEHADSDAGDGDRGRTALVFRPRDEKQPGESTLPGRPERLIPAVVERAEDTEVVHMVRATLEDAVIMELGRQSSMYI